jgi:hypothetical protein
VPSVRSALPSLQVEYGMRGVAELYARAAALPAHSERRQWGHQYISNSVTSTEPVIPVIPPHVPLLSERLAIPAHPERRRRGHQHISNPLVPAIPIIPAIPP